MKLREAFAWILVLFLLAAGFGWGKYNRDQGRSEIQQCVCEKQGQ